MIALRSHLLSVWARRSIWAPELAVLFGVALFATTYRLVHLEPIEIGGDALNKWHFARQWFHDFSFADVEWTHHLTRLGVNVPLGIGQLLFGRAAIGYHFAAVFASTATAVFIYTAGRLAHGYSVGIAGALWAVSFPSWERAGSQITPDAYGAAWAALAMVLLLVYARQRAPRRGYLIASSIALFWAYLAKEPLAFFVPGAVLATWIVTRRLWDAAIYAGVQLLLLALETLFYRAVSEHSSRFDVVSGTHGKRLNAISSLLGVFGRYENLESYWYWLLVPALAGALLLPLLTRDRRVYVVIGFPASFFFLYTFSIRGVNPLRLWTRFLTRYLDAGVPFSALLASLFGVVLVERAVARFLPATSARLERATRALPWAAAALLCCAALGNYLLHPIKADDPLRRTPRYARILTDAFRRGIPIVARGSEEMRYKALKAAYMVYIDDELLLENGKLPIYRKAYGASDVLVRKGAAPLPEACVVRVSTRDRFLVIDRAAPPGACD
jgi:hypothetical protein